jgi:hypothetical protein
LTARFGSTPQVRVVLQPVTVSPAQSVTVHDLTAHLAFSYTNGPTAIPATPDRAAFQVVVDDLRAMKRAAESAGVKTAGPLGAHPALVARAAGFSARLKGFLQSRLQENRLFAVAFMGLAPRPEPWVFFAMTRTPAGGFQISPQRPLGGATAQMLTFRGGPHVTPPPTTSNISAAAGVSTSVLFGTGIDARLDRPVLSGTPRPLHRDVPDVIANPNRSHAFNTDCVSCHSESARRRQLNLSGGDGMFAYVPPDGLSGVDAGHLPAHDWNLRNFGWFQRQGTIHATVSQRTANEAAESADVINRQDLRPPSADEGTADQSRRNDMPEPVAHPLTLVMRIKSPADFQALKALIGKIQSLPPDQNPIMVALNRLGTVHFARFVFIEERLLAVITTYDGSFEDYIDAFVDAIGEVFDRLLAHIDGAPPLPVSANRDAFLAFVQKHDLKAIPPFYSAYPDLKALDILALKKDAGQ